LGNLIEELKEEHVYIMTELQKAKRLNLYSPEAKEILFNLKTFFLNHLKKEDELLYPKLIEAGKKDRSIKKIVDTFASDMEDFSKRANTFFDTFNQKSTGYEYSSELGYLLGYLKDRHWKEETILFKKYDEKIG